MKARRRIAAKIDFSDFDQALQWFEGQPREASVTIAARSALRVLPRVPFTLGAGNFQPAMALPVFRATAVAWTAARYPECRSGLATTATAAARATAPRSIARPPSTDSASYAAAAAAASAAGDSADAEAAAYAAAAAAAATAAAAADAIAIDRGDSTEARAAIAASLAGARLWPDETPGWTRDQWAWLKRALLASGDDWPVWTDWYEDRIAGRSPLGEDFHIAVAMLADKLWTQGPKAINPVIRRLVEAHAPPEPIPAQGAGPHFTLSRDLRIALAPPAEIDGDGNDIGRIQQLLPLVRRAADDLAGHLNPNTQPELARSVADYREAIAGEPQTIGWGMVFGLGVRLENAALAARREIADRLQAPLEDAAEEALDSVLTLHGPMILATTEGRALSDEADRFRLTRDQQAALRGDAQAVVRSLRNSTDIIEPPAAKLTGDATEGMGEGTHPERGTVFGLATVKNVATILVPVAALGAFAAGGAWSICRRRRLLGRRNCRRYRGNDWRNCWRWGSWRRNPSLAGKRTRSYRSESGGLSVRPAP
jgi:hypothetical protein